LCFEGVGKDEVGKVVSCSNSLFQLKKGKVVVAVDTRYYRPTEVDMLIGDSTKARQKLGWTCEYNLQGIVQEMVAEDLRRLNDGKKI
jgi:GDPmannose 4,6-dehydratase